MNKVFSAVNQGGIALLRDDNGDDVEILEDGWAHFRHIDVEDLDLLNGNITNAAGISSTTLQAGNISISGNIISALAGSGHVNFTKNLDMNSNNLLNVTNINGNAIPAAALVDVSTAQSLTNKTIGNMLFGTNTITGSLNSNITISPLGTGVMKFSSDLNMINNNLVSVGNINSLTLPTSNFVGLSDSQTLTNKTINASQLVNNSVSLSKISTIGANTLLGNNTGAAATPLSIGVLDLKTMLNLSGVNNGDQALVGDITSTASGSTLTCTIASNSINSAKLADNAVTSSKLSTGAVLLSKIEAIGMQTFLGNSSNLTSLYPEAMSVNVAKTLLNLTGTNSGDQSLTGDVTSTGTTSLTTTITSGAVTLAKMSTLAANSIIGNNTGVATTPIALNASQVKSLLSLDQVQNTALSSWAGSSNITTIGTQTTVRTTNITSPGNLAITANGGASNVEIWGPLDMKTNNISNVGAFTSSAAISTGGVYSDFITARNTNTNLTLNANGTGIVCTGNQAFWINSTAASVDSVLAINGPTITNSRYVGCYQNGTYKLSFGLSASTHYFIYDGVNSRDLFQASITAATIRFPTYTTNGTLSVTSSNGTISSSSDRRLKQDEELLNPEDSMQKIMNLRPKKYSWKNTLDKINIGFIAQDVELIIPEAVDGKKYEYEFVRDGASQGVDGIVRLDEEGKPVLDYDKPRYRGLDQCAILSTLVSAVQALVQKNEALQDRVNTLEQLLVAELAPV